MHHKLTSALESMSAAMDKLSHAGKAERTALVNVALSSLKQLSTHLKYCLGGLRHGLERPAELPAPWPMGIKSLSKTQSLPAIPPAAAPRWETSDIYKRRSQPTVEPTSPGPYVSRSLTGRGPHVINAWQAWGGVVVEGRSRTSFVEPRPPEHAMHDGAASHGRAGGALNVPTSPTNAALLEPIAPNLLDERTARMALDKADTTTESAVRLSGLRDKPTPSPTPTPTPTLTPTSPLPRSAFRG